MSFDLTVWDSRSTVTPEDARRTLDQIDNEDYSNLSYSENFQAFVSQLQDSFPPIESLTEDTIDSSPWASGLEIGPGYISMNLAWSKAETVAPKILELSRKYDLFLYDPQEDELYLPGGTP